LHCNAAGHNFFPKVYLMKIVFLALQKANAADFISGSVCLIFFVSTCGMKVQPVCDQSVCIQLFYPKKMSDKGLLCCGKKTATQKVVGSTWPVDPL
jgi:hypothetical protein